MTDPELVDVRQAASDSGRSAETVRRWIWSGRLTATKRGNRLLIDRAELARFLRERQDEAPVALGAWAAEREAEARQEGTRGVTAHGSAAALVLELRARGR
ncbi:MAG: helix-turn-helix domain-containing protein [Candidatus Dormibacteraeota bacterium]|nr:helix-turn-helix domain-containing protein [Candidatus Dormibacteraeota bacterium]